MEVRLRTQIEEAREQAEQAHKQAGEAVKQYKQQMRMKVDKQGGAASAETLMITKGATATSRSSLTAAREGHVRIRQRGGVQGP